MFYGDIYLPLDIFASLPTVSKVFYGELFKAFVILLANLFVSAIFRIALFEAVLSASVADCLA